ncbi:hypothetical protein [Lysobacter gummosus]|uniref:hypothetical protein n=1 Tax=Lysobacter gummosus TaxID=262324 RepID=UPI003637B6D8
MSAFKCFPVAGSVRRSRRREGSLARWSRYKQRDGSIFQRKSKVNATMCGAGSRTSNCTAALCPGAISSCG